MAGISVTGTRLPFALLTMWFVFATAQMLFNAIRPPLPDTNSPALFLLAAVAIVLGIATIVLRTSRQSSVALFALVVSAEALLTAVVIVSAGGQGQLMAGQYLLLLGVISALGLERRPLIVVLVVGIVGYAAAVFVHRHLDSLGYAGFVCVLVVLVSLVVGALVGSLRDQALHDQLTSALNRRGLEQAAGLARDLASRGGRSTSVAVIDLDGFKAYNDEHGHAAGDELLTSLVAGWQTELRATDLLARMGGDEFVLVLPGMSREDADALMVRLRDVNGAGWTVGLSTWRAGEPLHAALHRADARMYSQKPRRTAF